MQQTHLSLETLDLQVCVCVSEQQESKKKNDLVKAQLRDYAPDPALSTVVPLLLLRHAQPGMEA